MVSLSSGEVARISSFRKVSPLVSQAIPKAMSRSGLEAEQGAEVAD